MTSVLENKRWVLQNDFPITARQIENHWLVYYSGDGRTHCLSDVMADVFSLIWRRPDEVFPAEQFVDEINNLGHANQDLKTLEPFVEALANLQLLKFV